MTMLNFNDKPVKPTADIQIIVPVVIQEEFTGSDNDKREFTKAIDLRTGDILELRYKGKAKDFRHHKEESAEDLLEGC